jgi:hypothetical protein
MIRYIQFHRRGLSSGSPNFRGNLLDKFKLKIGQNHFTAFLCQFLGNRLADSLRAAGNNCGRAVINTKFFFRFHKHLFIN